MRQNEEFPASSQEELTRVFNEQLAQAEAEAAQFTGLTIDVQTLRNDVTAMRDAFGAVAGGIQLLTHTAPFFSLEFLKQEGSTDIAKLDLTYMTTIGQQVISDSRSLIDEYKALAVSFNKLTDSALAVLENENNIDDQALLSASTDIVFFTENVKDYALRFNTICLAAIGDIVNHLNTARPADKQIAL